MARGRKSGAARNRDSDGEFNVRKRSPTKKRGTPRPASTNPRKGRRTEQQAAIDEGIAATPDDTTSYGQVENDDSTYASSPQQTPSSRGAAQNTGARRGVFDATAESFDVETAGREDDTALSAKPSKVVILRLPPDQLRKALEAAVTPEKRVTLKVSPEKLRTLLARIFNADLLQQPAPQAEVPGEPEVAGMAPVKEKNPDDVLDDHLKDVIQSLYEIGTITHGYLPESHAPLVNKGIDFTRSLASLSNLTADDSTHPAAPAIRSILIPPEVIDYVANGRNPDIYTREFVENVQRGNQVLNGKMQAFASFAEILARETKSAIPYLAPDMDRVMAHSGGFERENGTGDWKMKMPKATNGS